jgi:hypothetical protein
MLIIVSDDAFKEPGEIVANILYILRVKIVKRRVSSHPDPLQNLLVLIFDQVSVWDMS